MTTQGSASDITRRFFASAVAHPRAPALVDGEVLSYAGLAARVVAAARVLAGNVPPEATVAIEISRSAECLVAFLATLRAGAVPVLVDPALPAIRRELILGACRPQLRLTTADVDDLCDDALMDGSWSAAGLAPVRVHPQSLAYLCYTSGSTGTPKGVAVPRAALAARLDWGQDCYPLGPGDRVFWQAAVGFDFAIWEMLAPVCYGACVIVGDELAQHDMHATAEQIVGHRVTAAHFVPSVLRAYLRAVSVDSLSGLRYLFLGGEQCEVALLRQLRPLRATRLFNQYGPAETCIDSTCFECTDPDGYGDGAVPMGRPINGSSVYLLDGQGHCGAAEGELAVAGIGLARGYLNDPRATAERFVPDPDGAPGSRRYRTGDVVRLRPDGLLEFVTRRDDQVKVNGVRVELAEVRAAVSALCAAEVAVGSWSDSGGVRIAAFVAGTPSTVDTGYLMRGLRAALPGPMVPAVVLVPALAREASGKPDVRAMIGAYLTDPAPPGDSAEQAGPSETEARLAQIWAQVLHRTTVTAADNFFELGGHSLMAIEVTTLIEESFGVELPLREMFDCDTLGQLAKLVDALSRQAPDDANAI